jgi:hypothetical protein
LGFFWTSNGTIVTDHNDEPIFGGVPVSDLLRTAGDLAGRTVHEFTETIPAYRSLPAEELDGDITRLIKVNMALFATAIAERRVPTEAEMAGIARSAAQRAEEGVPLEALLTAYHTGTLAVFQALTGKAAETDLTAVRDTAALVLRCLQTITVTVACAYLDERLSAVEQDRTSQDALLSALLAGTDPEAVPGVDIADRYLVLAMAIGAHLDEATPGVDARIAGRRKLHRLRRELDRVTGVLSALHPTGGIVLLPNSTQLDELKPLWRRLTRAANAEITLAATEARPADVPPAVRQANEILDVVRRSGRPAGAYRLSDVLLDYQLTRPGPARAELAAIIDPIADQPDLLDTLDAYLRLDGNRRRTANLLHVHPNTVDYRLRRITALLGLDPTRPAHLRQLDAALTARRAERLDGPHH